jgi:hypothetical protein
MIGYRYKPPAPSRRFGRPVVDLSLTAAADGPTTVATLGPTGTSSEAAAGFLIDRVLGEAGEDTAPTASGGQARIALRETYEKAHRLLLDREADLLLVANAYAQISRFYMDPRLRLAGAFVLDTPQYGLAARADRRPAGPVTVATHPAPEPLIEELMPAGCQVDTVVTAASTSLAAAMADRGEVDLALTTELAAEVSGLGFVSRSRAIRMLWSVFALAPARTDTVPQPRA